MPQRWDQTVVIPTGAAGLSPAYDFGGGAKDIAVVMPATWSAAAITFQVSTAIDGTFVNLYNEAGTEISAAVAQGLTQSLATAAPHISQFRYVKVRSGTLTVPVNQGASRTLQFIFER
jgi:hypothetical protein